MATQRGVRTVRDTDLVQTVHTLDSLVRYARLVCEESVDIIVYRRSVNSQTTLVSL